MKKFSTILSKSHSTLLIAVTILTYAFTASAEEYKSMIRYDRVWECLNLEGPYKQTYIKCMRFDGSEMINGKLYHRLVTFKKSTRIDEGYQFQDDVYQNEGFLREENGIIYTLVEGNAEAFDFGEGFGYCYIPQRNPGISDTRDVNEYVLYNFNLKDGQTYDGMTYICDSAVKTQFKVISEESVEIDGDICKSIEVAAIDPYYGNLMPSHKYIEGIGAGEYGCLTHHEYGDQPTGMWMHNEINRVFDLDGNVIFRNLEGCLYEDLQYGSFHSTDGVSSMAELPESVAPCYDVLGRRIAQPAPGQLYIQGGSKHIAK